MNNRKSSTTMLSFPSLIILFIISQHSSLPHAHTIKTRQNLEIIIGGGGAPSPETPVCPEPIPPPPPPPEECPPPPPPPLPPPPSPPPPRYPPPPPPRPPRPQPPKKPPQPPKKPPNPPSQRKLSPELQRSKEVIERFRKTIGHDPKRVTDTWKGDICYDNTKYKGFICDTTIKERKLLVALVNFNNYEFQGFPHTPLALHNFLENLTEIIAFHSNSNFFSGGIPLGLDQIRSLFELDLSNNNLNGSFPNEVLVATNLTFLDLRFNHLSGPLNPRVFNLDLNILFLNNNYFTGPIPPALGQTPALYVTLANNLFTGPIPATIGNAKNTLLEILLLGNRLTGTLPYEIGLLEKATLFDASVNKITGQIPHSFGCLKSIKYLNMSMNQLCGPVPEPLCRLPRLVKLTLSDNFITQVGPACRKLIERKVLDVGRNCILDLPNQKSKEMCAGFFHKRPCQEPAYLNKIPCDLKSGKEPEPEPERKLMEKPRSYAALELQG